MMRGTVADGRAASGPRAWGLRKKEARPAHAERAGNSGGELGIRTPDSLRGNTRLAGEHLRPLGQLSVAAR